MFRSLFNYCVPDVSRSTLLNSLTSNSLGKYEILFHLNQIVLAIESNKKKTTALSLSGCWYEKTTLPYILEMFILYGGSLVYVIKFKNNIKWITSWVFNLFKKIPANASATTCDGLSIENKHKNRYKNIIACEYFMLHKISICWNKYWG